MLEEWTVGDKAEVKGESMGEGFEGSWFPITLVQMDRIFVKAKSEFSNIEEGAYYKVSAETEGAEPGCLVHYDAFGEPGYCPIHQIRRCPPDDSCTKPLQEREAGDAVDYAFEGGWWSGYIRLPYRPELGQEAMVVFPNSSIPEEQTEGRRAIPYSASTESDPVENDGLVRTTMVFANGTWTQAPPRKKLKRARRSTKGKRGAAAASADGVDSQGGKGRMAWTPEEVSVVKEVLMHHGKDFRMLKELLQHRNLSSIKSHYHRNKEQYDRLMTTKPRGDDAPGVTQDDHDSREDQPRADAPAAEGGEAPAHPGAAEAAEMGEPEAAPELPPQCEPSPPGERPFQEEAPAGPVGLGRTLGRPEEVAGAGTRGEVAGEAPGTSAGGRRDDGDSPGAARLRSKPPVFFGTGAEPCGEAPAPRPPRQPKGSGGRSRQDGPTGQLSAWAAADAACVSAAGDSAEPTPPSWSSDQGSESGSEGSRQDVIRKRPSGPADASPIRRRRTMAEQPHEAPAIAIAPVDPRRQPQPLSEGEDVVVCVDNVGSMDEHDFQTLMDQICPFLVKGSARLAQHTLKDGKGTIKFGWGALRCRSHRLALEAVNRIQSHSVLQPGHWLPRPLLAHLADASEPKHRWVLSEGGEQKEMLLGHADKLERAPHFVQQNHLEYKLAVQWRALELQHTQVRERLHNQHVFKLAELLSEARALCGGAHEPLDAHLPGPPPTNSKTCLWVRGVGCNIP